jgi:predicted DNA-binding transcriptional regulator AlpA
MSTEQQPAIISLHMVLKILGISRPTVANWIKMGLLPEPIKAGDQRQSRVYFKAVDFTEALAKLGKKNQWNHVEEVNQ